MPRRYSRVVTTPAAARSVRGPQPPFVSLTTDFGLRDPSPAICRGVVASIAPEAIVVDISHEIAKFQVRDGALLLWCALPYMPIGAHVGVVDPGVGTERLPVALETARGDVLVGPDNGLLIPAADRLGGIVRAHALENSEYRLPVVTASFHGRDIFAPAAAHIALGVPIEVLGRELSVEDLEVLDWPEPEARPGELTTAVVYVDTFGNAKLAGDPEDLAQALGPLEFGDRLVLHVATDGRRGSASAPWSQTFGRVGRGELLLFEDSYGRLCLARNQGSAAEALELVEGTTVAIARERRKGQRSSPVRSIEPVGESTGGAIEGEAVS
jgi:S-adenosyl-L-methionine hydrolase (adenosine-forming)